MTKKIKQISESINKDAGKKLSFKPQRFSQTELRLSKDVSLSGTSRRHELSIAIHLFEGEQRAGIIGCMRWQDVGTAQLKAGRAHSFPGMAQKIYVCLTW